MNKPQAGFTLLELVIAIAIFALLGLGCWRLFDAVVRVERSSTAQQQALRSLQRAVAMIERDVLQAQSSAQSPGVVLYPDKLEVRRVNWRNPLGLPRSEVQDVIYQLKDGVLWRFSRGLEEGAQLQQQKLLGDVREVRWRLFNRKTGWHSAGASAPKTAQHALELNLSVGRFDGVRRVLLLPGGT